MAENYFQQLNGINVNDKVEKKNGLSYVSWSYAWAEVKKLFPDTTYTIYENENGWNYFTDGRTCWVKTGVTINGIEHIEYLPVMDYRNNSIPADKVTSFDVNKAIQRSLTKACARHGLGLYIYAGEDLPESEEAKKETSKQTPQKTEPPKQKTEPPQEIPKLTCDVCHSVILGYKGRGGKEVTPEEHIAATKKNFGKVLCLDCARKAAKDKKADAE